MIDTLQAEVERRMRSHADAMPGGGHELCLEDAVAVAVEMIGERHRKWFARHHQAEKRAEAAEKAQDRLDREVVGLQHTVSDVTRERDEMKAAWYAVSKEAKELEEARDLNATYCDEAKKALADCKVIAEDLLRARTKAEKALAEHREKWGHARRCQCWNPIVGISRDPRCALAPEEKP